MKGPSGGIWVIRPTPSAKSLNEHSTSHRCCLVARARTVSAREASPLVVPLITSMSNSLRGDDRDGAPGAVDRFPGSTREACLSQLTTVFLDRDGVINENRAEHVKSWSEFRFIPGAREAIARLSRHGVRVFVVSNEA